MHPTFIELFGTRITTYGFMVALAFTLFWLLSMRRAKRLGYSEDFIQNLIAIIVISAFVCARLLHVVTQWDYYSQHPSEIIFSREGYAFLGGFIGAVTLSVLYTMRKGYNIFGVADIFAPYLALAHGIGRIGCLLFGCCFGGVCNLPWAIQFPRDSPAYYQHYHDGLIGNDQILSLPVHPTQIYESLFSFAHFGILLLIRKHQTFRGQLAMSYLMIYSAGRFIIEFFRGDDRGTLDGIFSTSQTLGILLFVVGFVGYFWLQKIHHAPDAVQMGSPSSGETVKNN
ncbi:MAG: prolipoprotein diacylglyceryl transferase [bacterium]|jgi:phosphatidylglycerol:prolipoprotein diacylglycerol transferase